MSAPNPLVCFIAGKETHREQDRLDILRLRALKKLP